VEDLMIESTTAILIRTSSLKPFNLATHVHNHNIYETETLQDQGP